MENCPYPGKREFALSTADAESDGNSTERRHITIQHVLQATDRQKPFLKIVQTADNFFAEQRQEEQNEVVAVIKNLLSAYCLKDFVDSVLDICKKDLSWKRGRLCQ